MNLARLKAAAGIALCVGLVAWGVWFVVHDEASMEALRNADPRGLLVAVGCMILFLWSNGLVLNVMMRSAGVKLGFFESLHLSVVTNAGNSFLPLSAGMGLRAFYLNARHGVSLGYFLGSLLGIYVVNFLVVFSIGTLAMGFLAWEGNAGVLPLLVGFSGATVALAALVLRPDLVRLMPRALARWVEPVLGGWKSLLSHKVLLFELAGFSLLNVILSSGLLAASFSAIGVGLDVRTSVYLSVVNSLGIFVKITPGNLGVNELILLGGGMAVKLDPHDVILASAVSRASQYLTLLLLLPFGLYALFGANWRGVLRNVLKKRNTEEGRT